MDRAEALIAYFYFVLPYVAYVFFLQDAIGAPLRKNFNPIWPLEWITWFSIEYADITFIIRLLFLACTLIGVLTYRYRAGRILVFLSVWQVHAFESSFGYLDHPWYVFLYASFILIWLPDIWRKFREDFDAKRKFLLVIWWAQAMFMLFYTLSGIGKILGIAYQWSVGQIHGLSLYGFAYQISEWLPRMQQPSPLGPFLIEHVWISWMLYLISIFFQACALWVMVRPSLQTLWSFELVMFHIGTYLIMGINFSPFLVALILLFFYSPFSLRTSWKDTVFDFPLFGPLIRYAMTRRTTGVRTR